MKELKIWPCPTCKREWGTIGLEPEECPYCKRKKGEDIDKPSKKLLSKKERGYFEKMLKENSSTTGITKELYNKLKSKNPNIKITKKALRYLLDKLKIKKQLYFDLFFNSLSSERVTKCHYCNGELVITGLMRCHGAVKINHIPDTYYYCLNCGKSHSYNDYCKNVTKKTNDIIFADCWSDY